MNEIDPLEHPNPCPSCGGTYEEHTATCKTRKVHPEVVSTIDLIMENQRLKGEIFQLKLKLKELEK